MTFKQHYTEIDVYKGLAILFIILGHSFCSFPVDFSKTSLIGGRHLLSTFSLNMFFLASGVLFSVKESWGVFLKKKLGRLMLPWLTFTVVALVAKKLMAAYVHHQAGGFGYELLMDVVYGKSYWFLYALFLMMVVTKLLKDRHMLTLLGGAILVSLPVIQYIPDAFDFLCIKRFIHYYPWFLMGFMMKTRYAAISIIMRNNGLKAFVGGILLFVCMCVMVMTGASHMYVIQYYLMPVIGCTSFYLMACFMCEMRRMKQTMTFFGSFSLQYYLNHLLIMLVCYYVGARLFAYSPLAALMVIFMMGVLISTLMLWVERVMPRPVRNLFGFL